MSGKLVSVVLPTYRRAHLLGQAIRSVLDQTYANLELIVVDDNSPDDTADVVRRIDDPRVRYVKNDPNLKLPRALNRGFSLAQGAYLTWTSDDNLYAPRAIARMVEALERDGCDFVYADYWLFSEQDAAGNPIAPRHDRLPDALQLEKGNHIGACFLYTRRLYEAVGDYDPELFLVEDYDYFLRAARTFRFCHVAEPLYYFRRDDETLYISRFPEVKTSDLLVRYKNGLLDDAAAAEMLARLLLRHPENLTDAWLRRAIGIREKWSYRLGDWLTRTRANRLTSELRAALAPLLASYASGARSFAETRRALLEAIVRHGRLAH